MFDLLIEGFSSAWLPCSLIVLVPGLATVMAAGDRLPGAVAGFAISATLLSWLRFAGRGGGWPVIIAALALIGAVVLLFTRNRVGEDLAATAAGALAGGAAAELWEPCVGLEFGRLLNELPDRGPTGLAMMAVFMAGVLGPLIGFVAIVGVAPEWLRDRVQPVLSVIGGVVLAVMGLATAAGLHDNVVSQLFQWSL